MYQSVGQTGAQVTRQQVPAAPAGWYADPYTGHGERYWDGQRWSKEFTREGPMHPMPPAAGEKDRIGSTSRRRRRAQHSAHGKSRSKSRRRQRRQRGNISLSMIPVGFVVMGAAVITAVFVR